jgi:hypothetical protein
MAVSLEVSSTTLGVPNPSPAAKSATSHVPLERVFSIALVQRVFLPTNPCHHHLALQKA